MSQTQEVRGVATSVRTEAGVTIVRYHRTDVVRFNGREVTLDSGGWQTATTKLRMNQASNQFNLGYQVYARRREWFVSWLTAGGTRVELPFADGMVIPQRALRFTGEAWVPA